MHPILTQDLMTNALSFKEEATNRFRAAELGDNNALKFSIIFAFQYFELMLKHHVSSIHPMLIYKKVFLEDIKKQAVEYTAKTISFEEALNFYNNTHIEDDTGGGDGFLPAELKWLQKNRNQIMHSHFSLNLNEAYEVLKRVLILSIRLYKKGMRNSISEQVSKDLKGLRDKLNEYSIHQNAISTPQAETPKRIMKP